MKKEYISTGKNVDVAIQNGLLEIGKQREEVDIKIVETGGLFKKAKVNLIYEVEEPSVKVEETIEKVEEKIEEPAVVEPVQQVETTEQFEEEPQQVVANQVEETVCEKELDCQEESEKKEEVVVKEKTERVVDIEKLKTKVVNFLNGLASKMNIEVQIECEEKDKELSFSVKGENVGKLIGYRGETLNAIQYLISCLKEREENRIRIYLDVEGYKAKREETLIELANKMADKAEEIERNVHLDPMSAYERRIVHTALQNREKVETESTGEGAKRHVVIKFKR